METTELKPEIKKKRFPWQVIIGMIFGIVLLGGMVLYLAAQYSSDSLQPFLLATAVALVGGATINAAFSTKCPEIIRPDFRRIGALCLLSTVAFIIFGLFEPIDKANLPEFNAYLPWIVTVFFFMGTISFMLAMILTMFIIPRIFFYKEK